MQMDEDQLFHLIDDLFPLRDDLKVEVIAALFHDQLNHNFSIRPIGNERRSYRKELHQVKIEATEGSDDSTIVFEVNRSGMYDILPQMLFHKPSTNNQLPDSDSFEKQVKYNNEQEAKARSFFQPIESVFYDIRALLMTQEITLLKNQFLNYEKSHFMADFWNFDPSFTLEDRSILVHILPFLVKNKNQVDSINFCLSRLCGNEIQMNFCTGRLLKFKEEEEELALIDARLGYNTVLGSSYYDENALWAEIQVKLNSVDEYSNYLDNSRQRKLIDFVMSYILPMEMEYELDFEVSDHIPTTTGLSPAPTAVLGINANIDDLTI